MRDLCTVHINGLGPRGVFLVSSKTWIRARPDHVRSATRKRLTVAATRNVAGRRTYYVYPQNDPCVCVPKRKLQRHLSTGSSSFLTWCRAAPLPFCAGRNAGLDASIGGVPYSAGDSIDRAQRAASFCARAYDRVYPTDQHTLLSTVLLPVGSRTLLSSVYDCTVRTRTGLLFPSSSTRITSVSK